MGTKLDKRAIVNRLRGFYFINRRMPSYTEMTHLLGYASKGSVRYAVNKLVDEGLLAKDDSGNLLPHKIGGAYPLLGSVQAGFPTPAEEELQDTISFDQYLVDNPTATYLIKVTGDSMIEVGIMPGDMIVVERTENARNGDIVVASVDGNQDWTLKIFDKKGPSVRLLPANSKYTPIIPRENLSIGGVVKGVVRRYA